MLNKQNIMNLVASSLYGFYDEILKDKFATTKYVDDAIANISSGGKTSNVTYDESRNALVIDASLSGGITYDSTNNALVFS